jgi:hypothetical protein
MVSVCSVEGQAHGVGPRSLHHHFDLVGLLEDRDLVSRRDVEELCKLVQQVSDSHFEPVGRGLFVDDRDEALATARGVPAIKVRCQRRADILDRFDDLLAVGIERLAEGIALAITEPSRRVGGMKADFSRVGL